MATAEEMRGATTEILRRMEVFTAYGGTLPAAVADAAARSKQHLAAGRLEQALLMVVAVADGRVSPGIQEAVNVAGGIYDDTMVLTPVVYDPEDRTHLPVKADGSGGSYGRITAYVEPTPIQLARRLLTYCREKPELARIHEELVIAQLMVDAGLPTDALTQIAIALATVNAEIYAPIIAQVDEVVYGPKPAAS